MYIDLSGEWNITLEAEEGMQSGRIMLPGILQACGYGNPVTKKTPWVSSLHDSFWYEQEEYKFGQEKGVKVPFLAQPPRHFLGEAVYERKFVVPEISGEAEYWAVQEGKERTARSCEVTGMDRYPAAQKGKEQTARSCEVTGMDRSSAAQKGNDRTADFGQAESDGREWHFHIEAARWRSRVWIDGSFQGEDCSLCSPHDIRIRGLEPGEHTIRVVLDNSMLYPYRPDAHSVSDALGGSWNGMVGEIALFTDDVYRERKGAREAYADSHPRTVNVMGKRILIDEKPVYFRATHFGGDFPLTGYPAADKGWWHKMMAVIKDWGLNGIRFHSWCPPEAAFAAADEAGIYMLVECGMWNCFGGDASMYDLLMREAERILENFGHHPSFVFFSPSNEPGGAWYKPLRRWVREIREYDCSLGYGGRRLYTAQSGWFYDVPPAEIDGTDFIYFHRSGYGPYPGGTIRNPAGWRGGSYSPSLEGVKKPVFCHELGQICAYPDYSVIKKFTGFLQPGNYEVFRENARANGILPYAEEFARCSGENQIRLYKEELEANFRTPELQGFELLDLHDYLGQGTALVGILDPFWESKGYGSPEGFKEFCGDTVLLAGCSSYVWKRGDTAVIPVEVCHYGEEDIRGGVIRWKLSCERRLENPEAGMPCAASAAVSADREQPGADCRRILRSGDMPVKEILHGCNTKAGEIVLPFDEILRDHGFAEEELCRILQLELQMDIPGKGDTVVRNRWDLYVFREPDREETAGSSRAEDFRRPEQDSCRLPSGHADSRLPSKPTDSGLSSGHADSCFLAEHADSGLPSGHADSCLLSEHADSGLPSEPTDSSLPTKGADTLENSEEKPKVLYTRNWTEAKLALEAGGRVFFAPWLSDMNYECPALSGGRVNWNGQMGPSWCRTMGVVIDEGHPIFRYFPTGHSGGWQWEDILAHARGFHMEGLEHIRPIVQPIDDWNRNLLQSLIFEARVLKGRLLFVSASLEGGFEERPAAFCLKEAILRYAASDLFYPEGSADAEAIERKLFPVLRMEALTNRVLYGKDGPAGAATDEEAVKIINGDAVVTADPNSSARIEKAEFPVRITIELRKPVDIQGILYVPEQRDRQHEGFVREYTVEVRSCETGSWENAAEGIFRNTCRSQSVLFDRKRTGDAVRLTVHSAYGCVDKYVWKGTEKGWYRLFSPARAVVQTAGIHIICGEASPHGDSFMTGDRKSRTKEIDP